MPVELPVRVHATSIAMAGKAAVIRGESGSGKSDLALRCLMAAPGPLVPEKAQLVADDYTEVFKRGGVLFARAPEPIAHLLEVRGVGIVKIEAVPEAEVVLVVDLAPASTIARLPEPSTKAELMGIELPAITLAASEPSAHAKLLLALEWVCRHGRLPDGE